MDDKWFKHRQKIAGVTAEDIGKALGRDRSAVSRIYVGRQKMTWDQAHVFAEVLKVPVKEVLEHAGLLKDEGEARALGFAEGEVEPYKANGSNRERANLIAGHFGGARNAVDIWTVQTDALGALGYLPGDTILVDSSQPSKCGAGDTVIAQVYDWKAGAVETVLRRFEPPILLAFGSGSVQTHVVDGRNVAIQGKVIACWREA